MPPTVRRYALALKMSAASTQRDLLVREAAEDRLLLRERLLGGACA